MGNLDPTIELQFRSAVRGDLFPFALSVVLLAMSLLGLTIAVANRRARTVGMAGFVLFALLYAMRLAVVTFTFRLVAGLDRSSAYYASSFITYVIPLPATLFWTEVVDQRWRTLLSRVAWAQLAFAIVGIGADFVNRQQFSLLKLNETAVILASLLIIVILLLDIQSGRMELAKGRGKILISAFAVFMTAVLIDNLTGMGIVSSLPHIEPAGLTIFLCAAGYFTISRVFENERRLISLNSEMQQAWQIQSGLLPQAIPQLPGLTVAACYRPMRAVAGDFYAFELLPDGRLGVLVGDVSGHGVPAALVASMLKTALVMNRDFSSRPAELMARMNRALCGEIGGQFVTAAYAVFDREQKTLTYAGAGHPPLLKVSARQDPTRLEENGLPLGLFAHAVYSEGVASLVSGDRVLLYSDGLVEAPNAADEQFGADRAIAVLQRSATMTASEAAKELLRSTSEWEAHGEEPSDDTTIVLVEVSAPD